MPYKIQLRRGTAAQWTAANPILADGEMGIESDTRKVKVGDGTTAWTSLGYNLLGDVADDAVTTAKILNGAVTEAKIANNAVTAAKLATTAAIQPTIVDAKGDLIVGTAADTVSRLVAGSNGTYLRTNSATTTGLEWGSLPANAITAVSSAEVGTLQNTSSTTFVDLATTGPSVTMTTGTSVLVIITFGTISPSGSSGGATAGVAVSGATTLAASSAQALLTSSGNNSRDYAHSYIYPLTVTAGSNTFTMKYLCRNGGSGGIAGFENRRIIVMALA